MSGEAATSGKRGSEKQNQRLDFTENASVEQFRNYMLDSIGAAPDVIIPSGDLIRFKINDKLNGWYVLHIDGRAAGSFGNWKSGNTYKWKLDGNYPKLSDRQRLDFQIEAHRQKRIHEAEESAKHKAAAAKAAYIRQNSVPAPESYAYLLKKGIKPHGARLGRDGRLIIPLQNSEGQLVNLQFISATGEKRFLYGGLKKGCFYILQGKSDKILICEGFATGASLNEATGNLTIVALDAGNLEPVAIEIRKIYPSGEIIICGDNDESGVGQKAARSAALAIGGKYIVPATPGNDWNDELSLELSHE